MKTGLERVPKSRVGMRSEDERDHLGGSREYDDEEARWLKAIETYRRVNHVGMVPNTELLWIAKQLGYRLVAPNQTTVTT